ncbi:hypothetical protein B0H19DRAFT_1010442 [Mycena capillaripes]|nr:hypothetical protein B0H19DRAFT_1010442 [Mycena capillaripes]
MLLYLRLPHDIFKVFGTDLQLPSNPFFALSLATNILVTALTGALWILFNLWRQQHVKMSSSCSRAVESGVIYSATVLAYLILGAIPSASIVQEPIFEMLTQVMGIAPTLIIVRVGLGVHVQNVESTVKTAQAMSDRGSTYKRPFFGPQSDRNKDMPAIPQDVEKGQPEYGSGKPWGL